jgi:hypothetical protein
LTKKEQEEEEEVAEQKETFFDAWKELEAARKYIRQCDTEINVTVICNEVVNESYRLTAQEEKKQKTD